MTAITGMKGGWDSFIPFIPITPVIPRLPVVPPRRVVPHPNDIRHVLERIEDGVDLAARAVDPGDGDDLYRRAAKSGDGQQFDVEGGHPRPGDRRVGAVEPAAGQDLAQEISREELEPALGVVDSGHRQETNQTVEDA